MERSERSRLLTALQDRLDRLDATRDNEAIRHDLLVYPILTKGLGWDGTEVLGQQTEVVHEEIRSSYYWQDAVPLRKRPDLIIVPYRSATPVAVVEEKKRQPGLTDLRSQACQLSEYQCLFNCIWGLITDGERWILKRNLEVFHEFSSLGELFADFDDLYSCIGRDEVLRRMAHYGTADLVVAYPSPHIRVVVTPHCGLAGPMRFLDLISSPCREAEDILRNMADMLDQKEEAWRNAHPRMELQSLVQHFWRNCAHAMAGHCALLREAHRGASWAVALVTKDRDKRIRDGRRWESVYYWTDRFYDEPDLSPRMLEAFINLYLVAGGMRSDGPVLARALPAQALESVQRHELFRSLPEEEINAIKQRAYEQQRWLKAELAAHEFAKTHLEPLGCTIVRATVLTGFEVYIDYQGHLTSETIEKFSFAFRRLIGLDVVLRSIDAQA